MYFDRHDIIEAYWLALSEWHDGRGRGKQSYGRFSRMTRYFRPSPILRPDTLTENGRMIYDAITSRWRVQEKELTPR